jgi:segregation and condensation protein A
MERTIAEEFESSADSYAVKLDRFEGPLDLLIHLIKRNEVNIYDIPIALITAQYLEYLALLHELNLDVAGEFLVMAATLIHIKSRMLLPRPDPAQEDPAEDPRSTSARRCARRSGSGPTAASRRSRARNTSPRWRSTSSA